jgi:hypothetical protein
MSRVTQEDRIASIIARNKPLEGGHHILSRGLVWSASIFRSVRKHHHIGGGRGVATVADKVFTHVIGVIDAAIQLMAGAIVIDSNEESFAAGHTGQLKLTCG